MLKLHEYINKYCSSCFGFLEDIFLKKIKQNKTQRLLIERTFLQVVTQTKTIKKINLFTVIF